ncbi:Histone-fold domain-containing protein new1 [Cladophialophora carrionii]|uniref:Histone-fold domain-containing protein new1 n=1 Tax=Cladophialophora carrionii TaxID=86049 RepID=A0A1C1CAJ4_9EURO|nr:Histone-fold domain-containing protein new1 [Cladophialophora carrionii]
MKAHSKSYPRARLRKIVKAHSRKRVGKTVDALVFLNFVLFIEELLSSASRKARLNGEKVIAAKDIRKATMATLRRFKG